jgi:hypothetical protein
MPAEARISSIWKKQKLFISLFLIAIGAWFFIDGFHFYPKSNERWLKYEEYEKDRNMTGWREYAKSRGWVTEKPHKFHKPSDITAQYVCGGLVSLIGGIVLIYWLTQKGRVLRSDDEAVYTPAGNRVPFEAITGLGLKQWDSKGIARVRYQINGKQGQFVIDDYKFDPDPTRQIFSEIEGKLKARTPSETGS